MIFNKKSQKQLDNKGGAAEKQVSFKSGFHFLDPMCANQEVFENTMHPAGNTVQGLRW